MPENPNPTPPIGSGAPVVPSPQSAPPPAPATSTITFDDFAKIHLRVGTVLSAELHPQADKLLVLQVDLGSEQRQIVAGIRGYYEPAALVGRQIIVVANLAPRTMRGKESQGMLLAASTPDRSSVVVLSPERPVPPGSVVS